MTALQREWYAKLRASGFEDIETGDEHSGLLKTDKRIDEGRGDEYAASAEYYRRAGVFLHQRTWCDEAERAVWELHADGVGMNEIARRVRRGNTLVCDTVNRLRAEMLRRDAPARLQREIDRVSRVSCARNERAFYGWLINQVQLPERLSDADLIQLAPTLLEIARPSTPRRSLTRS